MMTATTLRVCQLQIHTQWQKHREIQRSLWWRLNTLGSFLQRKLTCTSLMYVRALLSTARAPFGTLNVFIGIRRRDFQSGYRKNWKFFMINKFLTRLKLYKLIHSNGLDSILSKKISYNKWNTHEKMWKNRIKSLNCPKKINEKCQKFCKKWFINKRFVNHANIHNIRKSLSTEMIQRTNPTHTEMPMGSQYFCEWNSRFTRKKEVNVISFHLFLWFDCFKQMSHFNFFLRYSGAF